MLQDRVAEKSLHYNKTYEVEEGLNPYMVRKASVGDILAARKAGSNPAMPPIKTEDTIPAISALVGTTKDQFCEAAVLSPVRVVNVQF